MDGGPSITERVYAGIRSDLLRGAFRPGERLDATTVARRYGASVTPIREALNRLAGEGLIAAHAHQGFKVPMLTEGELRALYDWACQQLIAALRLAPPARLARIRGDAWPSVDTHDREPVTAIEHVGLTIAQLSGNTRCYRAVEQTNAELRTVRLLERELFAPSDGDLRDLPAVLAAEGVEPAVALLSAYHAARSAEAAQLAGLLMMTAHRGLQLEGVLNDPDPEST